MMKYSIATVESCQSPIYFSNMNGNLNTTGKRIKYLRETVNNWEKGTQFLAVLKQRTGEEVSSSTLSNHEKDTSMPVYQTLVNYAKVLGTTTDYLLLVTDDPSPAKKTDRNVLIEAQGEEDRRILEEIASLLEETQTGDLRFVLDIMRRITAVSAQAGSQPDVSEVEPVIKIVLDLTEKHGGKDAREEALNDLGRSMPSTPAYRAMWRRLRSKRSD